jgi:hypothetical protein
MNNMNYCSNEMSIENAICITLILMQITQIW